jgi:hypothetical protein
MVVSANSINSSNYHIVISFFFPPIYQHTDITCERFSSMYFDRDSRETVSSCQRSQQAPTSRHALKHASFLSRTRCKKQQCTRQNPGKPQYHAATVFITSACSLGSSCTTIRQFRVTRLARLFAQRNQRMAGRSSAYTRCHNGLGGNG